MTNFKKQFVLLLMLAFTCITWAQQRPIADVEEIAAMHLSGAKWQGHKASATRMNKAVATGQIVRSSEIMTSATGINADNEAFYIYTDGNSFVIVSGDERMEPVLAYSNTNAFEIEHIPSNVKGYLGQYVKAFRQLGSVENTRVELQTETSLRKAIEGNVEPIVQTQWNQDTPFNNLCPEIPNFGHAATGCVATAMAQAMSVYKYPACGTGLIDYTTPSYGFHLQDDLANYPFDWDNMLLNYNDGCTEVQGSAVAKLLYSCGLSLSMDYGIESSSYAIDVVRKGIQNYGYDSDMILADLDAMQISDWHALVTSNLIKGCPVIYSGRNEHNEGHAFIIDGYTSTESDPYYHVNWGWGGWCDGDYKVLHLSPESTGIGGGMGNYNLANSAILGFMPDNGMVENGGFFQARQIVVSPTVLQPGETSATVTLVDVFNNGARKFTGDFNFYLVDANGNRTKVGGFRANQVSINSGWNSRPVEITLPSSLENGLYTIEVCVTPSGFAEQPLYCGSDYPQLYVGGEPEPYDPDIMVTDLSASFGGGRTVGLTATRVLNYSTRTFTGKIKMAIADVEDNIITDFGYAVDINSLHYLNSLNQPQVLEGVVPSEIPDGNYHLCLLAQQSGYTNWSRVTKFTLSGNSITNVYLPCYVAVTIENGEINVFEEELPEFYANLQTTAFTVTGFDEEAGYLSTSAEKICNFGNDSFSGVISLCFTDLQGRVVETFGNPFTVSSPISHYSFYNNPQTIEGAVPTETEEGAYLLQLAAKQSGCRGWSVLKKWVYENGYIKNHDLENGIPCWIINGRLTFDEPLHKVTSITLNKTEYTLDKGESIQLIATVLPEDADIKRVVWSSSNEEVISVDATGLATCLAEGAAVVTAQTTDGSGLSATCRFDCTDGIVTITVDDNKNFKIFTTDGKRIEQQRTGVNIIRNADGTTRKVIKK